MTSRSISRSSGANSLNERSVNSPDEPSGRQSVNPPAPTAQRAPRRVGEPRDKPRKRARQPVRRKLLADYLTEARAAWTPGWW